MAPRIRFVAGLGNPGREYAATRHNAGFWFADALASRLGASFVAEGRFHGLLAKDGDGVRLLKPSTYMNLSGRAVAAATRFFGIAPDELLVVHDELDLKPGDARLKQGGGHAGHNGLRDIVQQLGTAEFWRLRIGIGHPRDSAIPQQDVADFVLRPPLPEERSAIEAAIAHGLDAWPALAAGEFERALTALHTRKEKP